MAILLVSICPISVRLVAPNETFSSTIELDNRFKIEYNQKDYKYVFVLDYNKLNATNKTNK